MKKLALLLLLYGTVVGLVIRATPPAAALVYDAAGYLASAKNVAHIGIVQSFFSFTPSFEDRGYSLALAVVIQIFGAGNILALQIANYLFWAVASWFIYLSLRKVQATKAGWWGLLMLFSPLFLTFSAKLYSEPFAALGAALLTYGIVAGAALPLVLGGIIFFATKSVFLLLIPIIFVILVRSHRASQAIWFLLVLLILIPSIVSASAGGRSSFNLAIQASKSLESVDEIVACVPYYFSYPVGKIFLPGYEGVCHQNDPTPSMSRYHDNPYLAASDLRSSGYTLSTWLTTVVTHPLAYLLVVIVSLGNIVFIEGVYPTILTVLPLPLMALGYLFAKIMLSLYLWLRVFRSSRHRSWIWLLPLLYFAVVVGNFPVEPRYFYPLLPYLYFLAGWDRAMGSTHTPGNHRSA